MLETITIARQPRNEHTKNKSFPPNLISPPSFYLKENYARKTAYFYVKEFQALPIANVVYHE